MTDYWTILVRLYFICCSIMFMFSVWINRYVAPKATLISLVAGLCFFTAGAIIFRMFFAEQFDGMSMSGLYRLEPKDGFQDKVHEYWHPLLLKSMVVFSLVIFSTTAYFKMQEKEV